MLTLPEAQKNDGFDGTELKHRVEGCQQVTRGKVEKIKSIKCQRDRDIVDDCDVNVARVCAPITIMIVSG